MWPVSKQWTVSLVYGLQTGGLVEGPQKTFTPVFSDFYMNFAR